MLYFRKNGERRGKMENYLSGQAVRKSRERARRAIWIFRGTAAASLVLFILLCLFTGTGNAGTMFRISLICMIPAGWAVIACRVLWTDPAKAEAQHLEGLEKGEPQIHEGRFTLSGDVFRIPKSVRVRKVRLETAEETLSLNLNEKLSGRMPPDGSLVRVETVHKFITALEVLEAAEETPREKPSRLTAAGRAAAKIFPAALLWAMLLPIFAGFVFGRITDTDAAHKIEIYAECETENAGELAQRLENELKGAVKMVKIHPFTYVLFGTEQLKKADLYIVPDSSAAEYAEWFAPGEGIPVYDPEKGVAAAGMYFRYTAEGKEPEVYRLYKGAESTHLEDGLAGKTAELLLAITGTEEEENP